MSNKSCTPLLRRLTIMAALIGGWWCAALVAQAQTVTIYPHEGTPVNIPSQSLSQVNFEQGFNAESLRGLKDYRIMSALLQSSRLLDEITHKGLDYEYEAQELPETMELPGVSGTFAVAQHRLMGYTLFMESDEVLKKEWGVPSPVVSANGSVANLADILAVLRAKCESVYGMYDANCLTSPHNAVNRWLCYHIMQGCVPMNRLVRHFNESGYMYRDWKNPQTDNLSVDVWDYYVSYGTHPALIKVSQDGDAPQRATSHNLYINRVSNYEREYYTTTGVRFAGCKINKELLNTSNLVCISLDNVLINDDSTQKALGSERIRFDVTTILPELLSGNYRGGGYTYFPGGYFSGIINESKDTKLLYLNIAYNPSGNKAWRDYQGDEMMALGVFDFTLKLPPVPTDGVYELRMAVSHNTFRGIAQMYVGESPDNLRPAGLPYDMRQAVRGNDNIGFVEEPDGTDDATKAENDKNMHSHGYMKAPRYFMLPDGTGASTEARDADPSYAVMRRIITTQRFEKDKTYYLRFKSALEKADAQFFIDYFEFCPSSVYNGATSEDQW